MHIRKLDPYLSTATSTKRNWGGDEAFQRRDLTPSGAQPERQRLTKRNGDLTSVGRAQLADTFVNSYVLACGGVPREVFSHAIAHQDLPRRLVAIGTHGFPDGQE